MKQPKIVVLGAGNFGTCLAQMMGKKGYQVALWTIDHNVADSINHSHRNPQYLKNLELSHLIQASTELSPALFLNSALVILAIPTQALRSVLKQINPADLSNAILVSAAKGIEDSTQLFPLGIMGDVLGEAVGQRSVVLSGPSFAEEVAAGIPTAVSLACRDADICVRAQYYLHSPEFRTYTSDDPIGLEVAGALKNVIAIASGAAKGMGFGQNSLAALMTRGMAEITRIGLKLGANPLTFSGLGGIGDLFLTCSSEKSRNFTVGYRLGRGENLADITASLGSIAEGVTTAKAAYRLAQKLNVDAPIIEEVHAVLYLNKPIREAVNTLLTREAKPELDLHRKKNP